MSDELANSCPVCQADAGSPCEGTYTHVSRTWTDDKPHDECQHPTCTRIGGNYKTGDPGRCVGYHCAKCGLPCSMMGHDCDQAIEAAWRREFPEGPLG